MLIANIIIGMILIVFLGFSGYYVRKIDLEDRKRKEEYEAKVQEFNKKKEKETENLKESLRIFSIQESQRISKEIVAYQSELYGEMNDNYQREHEKVKEQHKENVAKELQEAKERLEKETKTIAAAEEQKLKVLKEQWQGTKEEYEAFVAKLKSQQESVNARLAENLRESLADQLGRITLSKIDRKEISEINNVIKYFRNPDPIKKVIFEVYYRNKAREMINRITEGKRISGIYKITLVETDQSYIGQSVNIGDRWLQHIKRGLEVDPATNSLLYPKMIEYGIEAFRFEILEETADLNEREKFWGDIYAAKTLGFNLRVG